jgi:hypothetical protein
MSSVVTVAAGVDDANAALFFSTSVLLMGVLVTVIGAALVTLLVDVSEISDAITISRRRKNAFLLIIAVLCDLWGVGFPFWALYRSAIGEASAGLVQAVLASTILVAAANLAVPFYVISMLHRIQYLINVARIGLSRGQRQTEALRKFFVGGGYVDDKRFDELLGMAKARKFDYESALEFLNIMNKALVLGKREGISSPARMVNYALTQLILPLYARQLSSNASPVGTLIGAKRPKGSPGENLKRARKVRLEWMRRYKPSAEAERLFRTDAALAELRTELLGAAREAERQLRQAQARRAHQDEIRRRAKGLDTALTAAMRAAYAAQRAGVGVRGYDDPIYRRKANAAPRIRALNAQAERLLTLRESHRLNGIPAISFEVIDLSGTIDNA